MKVDHVVCLTLNRRPDRWGAFQTSVPENWSFGTIHKYDGVDGKLLPQPDWWGGTSGMFGCWHSHLRIWESSIINGYECTMVLEDDARFCKSFVQRAHECLAVVPEDWDQVYLGGRADLEDEYAVNSLITRTFGVVATHCYVIRRRFCERLYKDLVGFNGGNQLWDIDQQLRRNFHKDRSWNVYRSSSWLSGQAAAFPSDTRAVPIVRLKKRRLRVTDEGVTSIR